MNRNKVATDVQVILSSLEEMQFLGTRIANPDVDAGVVLVGHLFAAGHEAPFGVFVDQQKMELLFNDVDFGEGFIGLRDRLMLELLYATGMRLAELIGIKDADVDLFAAQVKVLGKRNKERISKQKKNIE